VENQAKRGGPERAVAWLIMLAAILDATVGAEAGAVAHFAGGGALIFAELLAHQVDSVWSMRAVEMPMTRRTASSLRGLAA